MPTPAELLLRQYMAQLEVWVDLGPGLRVCVHKLRETELAQLRDRSVVDVVAERAVNWSGFSSATLLGAAVGSSDAIDFDRTIWAEAVRRHAEWINRVAEALVREANALIEQRAAASGN